MDSNFDTDIFQICITYMIQITSASPSLYLDYTLPNTHLTIRQKLNNCIPELDISIVSNAVICNKCADTIKSFYEFKKQCLQSEIHIKKYIQQVQHTGDINFEEVQSHQPHNGNHDTKIKLEDFDVTGDFKNEGLVCEPDVFNGTGNCTESMESKYLLSLENVDTQFVFLKTDENYSLSATEENLVTPSSDIASNCLSEAEPEHQDSYSSYLNKIHVGFQCYRCGYKSESKLKLGLHLTRHRREHFHGKEINSSRPFKSDKNLFYYRCSLCSYLTKYKCLFNFHNRIHLTKKNYKRILKHRDVQKNSNKLNKKKNNKNLKFNLTAHMVTKLFKCSICEYQSKLKIYLEQHMRTHTEEKPFTCSICEYQSSQKCNLKKHMQIHTGNKPFSCSVCEYQSRQKSNLKKHMLIHTGEKPFACSTCEYQCRRKQHLKEHMLMHTAEKLFSCSVCEYQCNRKYSLKKHIRIHTGEKPYSCSICEYQCSRKEYLKRHIVKVHTGEEPFSCSIVDTSIARTVT